MSTIKIIEELNKKIFNLEKKIKELEFYFDGFNSAAEPVALVDLDGRFRAVNEHFCRLVEYKKCELLNMTCMDLISSEFLHKFIQYFNLIPSNDHLSIDTQCNTKYGKKKYIFIISTLIKTKNNSSILLVSRDNSESVKIKTTLYRFDKIYSLTNDLLIYINRDYTYKLVNEQFCKDYNIDKYDVLEKTVSDIVGKEVFLNKLKNNIDKCFLGQTVKFENWFFYKTIGSRYRQVSYYPDQMADGSVRGLYAVIHDMTDYKNLEIELKRQNEQLLTLINSSPDFIWFKDGESRWLLANKALIEFLQFENIDYKYKHDNDLIKFSELYREILSSLSVTDEDAWKNTKLTCSVEQVSTGNGSVIWFDVARVPLFNRDGSRKGLVIIAKNITEQFQHAQEISLKNKKINEVNIALKVLLDQQQDKCRTQEKDINSTLGRLVFPYIDKLSNVQMEEKGQEYLKLISAHLRSVIDSFSHQLDDPSFGLSPKEILVADLVRQRKSSREIGKLLGLKVRTVEIYRNSIRRKLKISGKKINLQRFLNNKFPPISS